MRFSKNFSVDGKGWRRSLVIIAICSLTVTLATRFSIPPDSHIHAFKSDNNGSGEGKQIVHAAASYLVCGFRCASFEPSTAHTRIVPSLPARTRDVSSSSLYNRPPPSSIFI
jgi:hypothetical protein